MSGSILTWTPSTVPPNYNYSGDWDLAVNWSGGVVPDGSSTVIIPASTTGNITLSTDSYASNLQLLADNFHVYGNNLALIFNDTNGTVITSSGTNSSINCNISLQMNSLTINTTHSDSILTLFGIISSTIDTIITVNGPGIVVFSGNNTFSGQIVINRSSQLQITSGDGSIANCNLVTVNGSFTGSGTVKNILVQSGGTISYILLTVTGNLTLASGSIFAWWLFLSSIMTLCSINVHGNIYTDPTATFQITIANTVDFTSSFWASHNNTPIISWDALDTTGLINNTFSNVTLVINGAHRQNLRGPSGTAGAFSISQTAKNINVYWLTDSGGAGDPHITTISGRTYNLPNFEKCAEMYNNGELSINTEMKTMPRDFWPEDMIQMVINSTYLHKTRIRIDSNDNSELIIDNHNLDIISYKGTIKYSFEDYDTESYHCIGINFCHGSFRAKLLTFTTKKLGIQQIAFVTFKDKTVVNDMCLLANSSLRTVIATGALVNENHVKWSDNFSY